MKLNDTQNAISQMLLDAIISFDIEKESHALD
jgi:hypothetical protein